MCLAGFICTFAMPRRRMSSRFWNQAAARVESVYETSFDVISPVSFSEFRHLLKQKFPDAECLVILPKNARQISSGE